MQLRLVQRLLRLDANRNTYTPEYQQHPHLDLVIDTQDPSHRDQPPREREPSLPTST
jgi:hypothetical protein